MKYKTIAIILALLYLLSACGGNTASSLLEPTASPEAFGEAVEEETPVQAAQTTALPETSDAEEEVFLPPSSSTVEEGEPEQPDIDFTEYAVKALVLCDYLDGLSYSPEDPVLFWRAMGYLIDSVKEEADCFTWEDDRTWLKASDAPVFAKALFGDYEEDFPAVTEEDPYVTLRYEDDQEVYGVREIELPDLEILVDEILEEPEDAARPVRVEVLEDGETVAVYQAEFNGYVHAGRLFAYSVTALDRE